MIADAMRVSDRSRLVWRRVGQTLVRLGTSQVRTRLEPSREPVLAIASTWRPGEGFVQKQDRMLRQITDAAERFLAGIDHRVRASCPLYDGTGSVLADEAFDRSRIHRI
jgi:hypothetical protein